MSNGFAYAQARVQARYGRLADEAVWDHLEASRSLPGFLGEARLTPLEPWVSGFSPRSGSHHIEQELSRRLHRQVLEARRWVPESWREAVVWTRWLPELPRLSANPRRAPHDLKALDVDLLTGSGRERELGATWLKHWRELWPRTNRRERENLERLIALSRAHGRAFLTLPATQGDAARRDYADALRRLFRRVTLQPAALFTWLLLQALELERLRGALVSRALFDNGSEP